MAAPVNIVPGSAYSTSEDVPIYLTGLQTSDPDTSTTIVSVTLSVAHGTLFVKQGLVTFSGSSVTLNGTIAQINAILADANAVQYVPNANFNGVDQLTMVTNDSPSTASGLTDTDIVNINVGAVNDAPVNTVPGAQTVVENVATPITGISISDVDAGAGNLSVTLGVAHGNLSVAPGGLASLSGNGTAAVVLQGTVAQINAALATLVYQPTAGYGGPELLSMSTNDLGNTGGPANTTISSVAITVAAINDAPINTVPGAQVTNEDTAKVISGISIADPDAGSGSMSVQLKVAHGSIHLASGAGVTIGGNDTGTVTLSGTLANINALLGTVNAVTYTPAANYSGADSLLVTTNDNGNTGTGGAKTDADAIPITVLATNDAPDFAVGDGDGEITTALGPGNDVGLAIVVQPDGRIVVSGYSTGADADFAVARYNADGTLDPTFGTGGTLKTNFGGNDFGWGSAYQLADGKILVAGSSDGSFALARYNTDGSLDPTFGLGGILTTNFTPGADYGASVLVQPDGKIVVGGTANNPTGDFALARYNANGTLDATFGSGGKVMTSFSAGDDEAVSIARSGSDIIVGGSTGSGSSHDFLIARYSSTGVLLGSTATNMGGDDRGQSIIVQPDGKILVAGFTQIGGDFVFAIARYNADLTLDNTFSSDGKLTTDFGGVDQGFSITLDAAGRILVAGQSSGDFAVARYNADGSLDTSFSTDGKHTIDIGTGTQDLAYSVAVQPDGKILLAGFSAGNFALVRLNADGTPDANFDSAFTTPSSGPIAITVLEDTTANGVVHAIDPDGDPITFSAAGALHGVAAVDPNTGAWTYTPNANYNGPDAFTIQASDGLGGVANQLITVTVTPVNDAPNAVNDAASGVLGAPIITGNVLANDIDPDGTSITPANITGFTQAANGTVVNNGDGTFTYTPNVGFGGASDSFTYTITDAGGLSDNATVTINFTHPPAFASASQAVVTDEDVAVGGSSIATDPDPGDVITYSTLVNPALGSVTINPSTGAWTYTPLPNQPGIDQFTIQANDGHGGVANQVVNVTINSINDDPVNQGLAPVATNENTAVFINGLSVSDVDSGFTGMQTVTLKVDHGKLDVLPGAGVTITNNGTGTVTLVGTVFDLNPLLLTANAVKYTPDAGFIGLDSFTMTSNDGGNSGAGGPKIDSDTVSITVENVNDAPVNQGLVPLTTAEDTPLVIGGLSVSDADSGFTGALTLTLDVDHGKIEVLGAPGVTITGNGTGTVTLTGTVFDLNPLLLLTPDSVKYTPDAGFVGDDPFTMHVTDNGNTGIGGPKTDTDVVNITVAAANDPPVNHGLAPIATNEDVPVFITGLSVSDPDAGAAPVTVTLDVDHGKLDLIAGAGVTTTNNGTATVTLTGSIVSINALLATANALKYTPEANYPGTDTFTMTVNDNGNTGAGGALSDTDAVTITMTSINDAPTNQGLAPLTTTEDTVVAVNGLSVSDPDSGFLGLQTVTLHVDHGVLNVALPGVGVTVANDGTNTVTLTGTVFDLNPWLLTPGTVRYTPDSNFTGVDSLTMTSNDNGNTGAGGALGDLDTVSITVTPVNDSPTDIILTPNAYGTSAPTFGSVGALSAVDPDSSSFTFTSGNVQFVVAGTDLQVPNPVTFAPGAFNTVNITADDGSGGTYNEDLFIDVGTTGADDTTGFWSGPNDIFYWGIGGDDKIVTSNGNDYLNGGAGVDQLIGGNGNDILVYDGADLAGAGVIYDGGAGTDTLRFEASSGLDMNTAAAKLAGLEVIDLHFGSNTITNLLAADVVAISDTNQMIIKGEAGDSVTVGNGVGWTHLADQTIEGQLYDVYTQGSATLLIDKDISQSFV